MSKKYFLPAIIGAVFSLFLSSCVEKSQSEEKLDPASLKDQFVFNDRVRSIKSAIYEISQADSLYTFWFSPTANIVDPEGMEIADDFIRISTRKPDGKIDMGGDDSELVYGEMTINAFTFANYRDVDVTLDLNSAKTVKLQCSATSPSGARLDAKYYNLCFPVGYTPGGNTPGSSAKEEIILDRTIYSYYFGLAASGYRNYYLAASDAPYSATSSIRLDEPGTILILDLYCENYEDAHTLVEGIFTESTENTNMTYDPRTSGVIVYDDNLVPSSYFVEEDVTVTKNSDGTITVKAHYYDADDNLRTISYTQKNDFLSYTGGYYNPQFTHNVELKGYKASASYQGNVLETATGLVQIMISDEEYSTLPEGEAGGHSVCLVVFSDLFGNSRDCHLTEGLYMSSTRFGAWGSWMPGMEVNYFGIILPLGTYAHYNDGTGLGQFMYLSSGTVQITQLGENWRIEFELESPQEYTVKGVYEGPVPITDDSDDKDKDDGTSTLERDYDMDLDYLPSATMYTTDNVYIRYLGYRPASRWDVDVQRIAIGKRSGTDMSDVCWLEFLTEPGMNEYIVPGTYPVADNNYPDAYFKPGVACAGSLVYPDERGCFWMHFYQTPPYHEGYIDGHAYFYDGVIEVSYDETTGFYTFDIDGICVRKHHVRSTWTGPVYLGGKAVTPPPGWDPSQQSVEPRFTHPAFPKDASRLDYTAGSKIPLR